MLDALESRQPMPTGPELAAALQSHKLSNCGVAALEVDFSAAPGEPLVSGAQLLFGTRLVP